jgi:hypothetical protein
MYMYMMYKHQTMYIVGKKLMIFQWATKLQEFCRQIFERFGLFTFFSTILHI